LQFFAQRATKLRFLAVAVAKLKFCNSLFIIDFSQFFAEKRGKQQRRPMEALVYSLLICG
jgi:hypothetical protein